MNGRSNHELLYIEIVRLVLSSIVIRLPRDKRFIRSHERFCAVSWAKVCFLVRRRNQQVASRGGRLARIDR